MTLTLPAVAIAEILDAEVGPSVGHARSGLSGPVGS